ncbi:hypothetical protein JHD47_07810 [Sulfurimonas sp. SAG-AH-194-L11]|nr:DUF234 domain-containing protein [Sulfurimonas sp. SAG-AH-194-L11]MDF1877719.1 hypothetical protein [Sulfurimonas sp. SAG-AH-194-L11]
MQTALEKFSIFGGVDWGTIDTSKESIELIKELILPDFRYIRNDITELTDGLPLHHSILTGLAMGDSRLQTAFKRAGVSKEVGENAIFQLSEAKIIRVFKETAIFNSPFLRFWFAFISPIFKGIRDGDYKELSERWEKRGSDFVQLTFAQLSYELIKLNFKEDRIKEIRPLFEEGIELDIYAKTSEKKIIAGVCRYSNAKIKKSELTKLQETCKAAGIEPDIFVIVAKNGFSKELKELKSDKLRLITLKNFKKLVE